MEYRFKITTVPEKKSGYHLPAYTEGPLEVWLDGQQFVRVDEALLVEFAVVLSKWLRAQPSSLYYASMDFEEEPIFALSLQGDAFEPSSVWASGAPVVVSTQDAIAAAQHYIDRLSAELKRYGGDLHAVIDAAIAADS